MPRAKCSRRTVSTLSPCPQALRIERTRSGFDEAVTGQDLAQLAQAPCQPWAKPNGQSSRVARRTGSRVSSVGRGPERGRIPWLRDTRVDVAGQSGRRQASVSQRRQPPSRRWHVRRVRDPGLRVVPWGLVRALDGGGPYRGREGVEKWVADIRDNWEELQALPQEFRDLGDRVLVLGRLRARGKGSGAPVDTPFASILSFSSWRQDLAPPGVSRSCRRTPRGRAARVAAPAASRRLHDSASRGQSDSLL